MSAPFARIFKNNEKTTISIITIIGFTILFVILFGFLYYTELSRSKIQKEYKNTTVKSVIYRENSNSTVITGKKDQNGGILKLKLMGNHTDNFPINTKFQYHYKKKNH